MKVEVALILASHGDFAKEALKSLEMIVGKQANSCSLSLFPGTNLLDFTEEMERAYQELDTSNGAVIICDIYGGTPSNAATAMLLTHKSEKILAYSGLNLSVLLELSANRKKEQIELKRIIEEAAKCNWAELKMNKEKPTIEGGL